MTSKLLIISSLFRYNSGKNFNEVFIGSFYARLLTDRQTDRQTNKGTDKRRAKRDLLAGGSKEHVYWSKKTVKRTER